MARTFANNGPSPRPELPVEFPQGTIHPAPHPGEMSSVSEDGAIVETARFLDYADAARAAGANYGDVVTRRHPHLTPERHRRHGPPRRPHQGRGGYRLDSRAD